ncbi:MAG: ABC transporter ATP-binding protein [Eubacteriales bacterium]
MIKKNKPDNKNRNYLGAYYKAAKPALKYKWCYAVLTLLGIILIIADLAFAQNSRELFGLGSDISRNAAVRIIIRFVIIIAAQYIFGFAETYISNYFNESVIYAMRRDLLGKIQRLKMEFFDNNHTAKIQNTFFNQIEVVKNFVVTDIRNMIKLPLTFVLIGAYLFTVHPYLGITAVIASVLQLVSNVTFKKSFLNAHDKERKVDQGVYTTMGETTQGIREVKINQVEDFIDSKLRIYQKNGVKYTNTRVKYQTLRGIIKEIPIKIGYVFGLSAGIYLMMDKSINPGDLVAFITLLHKVSEPFNGIAQTYSNFQRSLRSANDLLRLVDEPEEDYHSGETLNSPIDHIKFNNVSFLYRRGETSDKIDGSEDGDMLDSMVFSEDLDKNNADSKNILSELNFEIKGGSTVALVGPSGSGKSTVIKLLYKFYEPTSGEILINNKPLRQYNINSLRKSMSIVSQDIFLFDGTVRDNLVLGRENISDHDIENVLKFSQSYDFVMNLPEGLDTNLGERGIKLSQGQKQRLSIARSIIKKAYIIILDEPTSALDVETEYSFQQNITEWAKDCTKLIIAHRLTTIRDADYILFLEEGKIVEQGSPYDLIRKKDGKFKDYWEKQFLFQEEKELCHGNIL